MPKPSPVAKAVKLPISRTRIAGKRRITLSHKDLAKQAGCHELHLRDVLRRSPLRRSVDYLYHDATDTYFLTLSAAQMLLVTLGTDAAWSVCHRISDFIQDFKHKERRR